MLQVVTMSLLALLAEKLLQSVLVFGVFDSKEEYLSDILYNISQLRSV